MKKATIEEPPIVTRKEWGALTPTAAPQLFQQKNYPVDLVYVSLNSGMPDCDTKDECIKVLQEAQKEAQTKYDLSDIPFNFIISKDGTVYEGRGWDTKPDKAIKMEKVHFSPFAYDFTLFGDYSSADIFLPDVAINKLLDLIQLYAVKKKYIYELYDIQGVRTTNDKFEPDLCPSPEMMKQVKPIQVKERVDCKHIKRPKQKQKKAKASKRPPFRTFSFDQFFR